MGPAHMAPTRVARLGTRWTGPVGNSASSPHHWKTRSPRRWPGIASRVRHIPPTRTAKRSLRLPERAEVLARWIRVQAQGCAELGSPFYASMLESAAADLEAGGEVLGALAGFDNETEWSALALRLMGAVHRMVLQGRLPQLEPHYPSVGGDGDAAAAWPFFRGALREHGPEIRRLIERRCQTNE